MATATPTSCQTANMHQLLPWLTSLVLLSLLTWFLVSQVYQAGGQLSRERASRGPQRTKRRSHRDQGKARHGNRQTRRPQQGMNNARRANLSQLLRQANPPGMEEDLTSSPASHHMLPTGRRRRNGPSQRHSASWRTEASPQLPHRTLITMPTRRQPDGHRMTDHWDRSMRAGHSGTKRHTCPHQDPATKADPRGTKRRIRPRRDQAMNTNATRLQVCNFIATLLLVSFLIKPVQSIQIPDWEICPPSVNLPDVNDFITRATSIINDLSR